MAVSQHAPKIASFWSEIFRNRSEIINTRLNTENLSVIFVVSEALRKLLTASSQQRRYSERHNSSYLQHVVT